MGKKSILLHTAEQELAPSKSEYCHIGKLNEYEDNSIDEIILQDLCDYILSEDVKELLENVFNKITSGGRIYIQGSDLKQLCIAVSFDMVNMDIIKKVLYPKKSIHNMSEILSYLKNIGFHIDHKKYINIFEYYIQAHKE